MLLWHPFVNNSFLCMSEKNFLQLWMFQTKSHLFFLFIQVETFGYEKSFFVAKSEYKNISLDPKLKAVFTFLLFYFAKRDTLTNGLDKAEIAEFHIELRYFIRA